MESGQNKAMRPLLSIAIPTWNRANQISEALKHLLPQIEKYPGTIEFIISDNASTDNTVEVINGIMSNYSGFDYQLFEQKENTGFFGNFHKCISLGTGKYCWLLSDDDYLFDGLIDFLMKILIKEDIGAVFLNDWTDKIENVQSYSVDYVNKNNFFSDKPFRHSLISSVIFTRQIDGSDEIFTQLKGNALIGYAVYLKAIHKHNKFAILKGNSLLERNDQETRFNALWIFTVDLAACIKLAKNYHSQKIISMIANSFLENNTSFHYKSFKFSRTFGFEENKSLKIFKDYLPYKSFWTKIAPLVICPKFLYQLKIYFRR